MGLDSPGNCNSCSMRDGVCMYVQRCAAYIYLNLHAPFMVKALGHNGGRGANQDSLCVQAAQPDQWPSERADRRGSPKENQGTEVRRKVNG